MHEHTHGTWSCKRIFTRKRRNMCTLLHLITLFRSVYMHVVIQIKNHSFMRIQYCMLTYTDSRLWFDTGYSAVRGGWAASSSEFERTDTWYTIFHLLLLLPFANAVQHHVTQSTETVSMHTCSYACIPGEHMYADIHVCICAYVFVSVCVYMWMAVCMFVSESRGVFSYVQPWMPCMHWEGVGT